MPHIHAGILSETQALAGIIIFLASYVVFALGKFPSLTRGRPRLDSSSWQGETR